MRVLIFGYGLHGSEFDSAMYFLSRGDEVRLTDIRDRLALGDAIDFLESKGAVIHCGGHITEDFIWADIVIKSPTIRMDNEFLNYSKHTENDITYVNSRPESNSVKIICVTGAHNKTTTASAICHALKSMGKTAHMCGNMGISAFSELRKWDAGDIPEYVIIELSSWQARDTYSFMKGKVPHIEVSVITTLFDKGSDDNGDVIVKTGDFNIHANHIICPAEVREGVEKIAQKKAKTVSSIESASRGISKSLQQKMKPAFAVLRKLGFSSGQINDALKCFKGIPNRSELVLRTDDVIYINDSSSVFPASVNFTMDNLGSLLVHLICGGSESSLDPSQMLKAIKSAASIHLLDGSFTAKKLLPLLKKHRIKYNGPYKQMEEAVSSASSKLNKDSNIMQVILLSPGAAAFENFENEFARGESFKEAVSRTVSNQN